MRCSQSPLFQRRTLRREYLVQKASPETRFFQKAGFLLANLFNLPITHYLFFSDIQIRFYRQYLREQFAPISAIQI